eukprot:855586-Pelagomonas_calceolata.AAC.1
MQLQRGNVLSQSSKLTCHSPSALHLANPSQHQQQLSRHAPLQRRDGHRFGTTTMRVNAEVCVY